MPKRVLDFDALWASEKLSRCAAWAQAEYAWLYGLADASGSFELTNLRVIWGRVGAIRANFSVERLEQVFDEFRDKGLLFVWEDNGKRYGHWTGSEAPGRLPPSSWRVRMERLAPPVPVDALAEYVRAFAHTPDSVRQRAAAPPQGVLKDPLEDLKDPLESPQGRDGDRDRDLDRDLEGDRDEVRDREGERGTPAAAPQPCREAAEAQELSFRADLSRAESREPGISSEGFLATSRPGETRLGMTESGSARGSAPPEAEARFAYHGVLLDITARQDALLAAAFPWVERQAEYRKMESWLEANPLRRPRSASRFVHNWFSKVEAPKSSSGQSPRPVPVEARVGRGPQGPVRVRPEYLEQLRQRAEARAQNPARASPVPAAAASTTAGSPRDAGAALETDQ